MCDHYLIFVSTARTERDDSSTSFITIFRSSGGMRRERESGKKRYATPL